MPIVRNTGISNLDQQMPRFEMNLSQGVDQVQFKKYVAQLELESVS